MICHYCKQEIDINAGNHDCEEGKQARWGFKQARQKRKPGQSDTNYLTQQIIDYVISKGGAARRVNVTGRYIEGNPIKIPTSGGKYRTLYTKGKWIKSGMLPGFEDISAIKRVQAGIPFHSVCPLHAYGQYVAIEVKGTKGDRLSHDQILRKDEVERAGGLYNVARDFEQFKKDFDSI